MCFIDQARATAVPPWSLTIPLGYPVVPEVYRTYSGCDPETGSHSTGSANFMAV